MPQKQVVGVENLKVDGGINGRRAGGRPDIFRELLALSSWEGEFTTSESIRTNFKSRVSNNSSVTLTEDIYEG